MMMENGVIQCFASRQIKKSTKRKLHKGTKKSSN